MQVPDDHIFPFSVAICFVKPCSLHYGFFWILGTYCALKGREYFISLIIIHSRSLDNGEEVILMQHVHLPSGMACYDSTQDLHHFLPLDSLPVTLILQCCGCTGFGGVTLE